MIFEAKKKRYGSPRIHAELQQQAVVCSRGRVARLMRAEGLCALSGKKYRRRREQQDVTETKNLLLELTTYSRMSWRPHHRPARLRCTPTHWTSHISTSTEVLHQPVEFAQYTSYAYQRELTVQKMLPSFTAKGACLDNACMQSFWATLKKELVYPQKRFVTSDKARQAVLEYIHVFYNRERLHSSLGYTSPELFEALQQPSAALDSSAA